MWVSQANEDCQRAANHQPTTTQRPQKTVCLNCSFPKTVRLIKQHDFRRLKREGTRVYGVNVTFSLIREKSNNTKLGITVSKKFGHAAKRNLFKRRVREAFRQVKDELPEGLLIHISPKSEHVPLFAEIQEDFRMLITHVECRAAESR